MKEGKRKRKIGKIDTGVEKKTAGKKGENGREAE